MGDEMAVRKRMLVYSPQDEYLFDIPYSQIYDGSIRERINGEHTMNIVTSVVLEKEQRILWRDKMNKWREYVITSVDKAHTNGGKPIGTYKGVWSLQHDAQVSQVSRMPGVQNPVQAETALEAVLDETERWQVGQVTIATYGGASMYDMQVWDALKVLLEVWGGEIDARIVVDAHGVVGRYVDYHPQIGKANATRRFTYARDMTEIHRVVEDSVVACRIVPRGKGEETGEGYGRKIKIGDVNDGIDWLQNNASAALYRMPDGNGGYEYPTVFADNGDIEDEQELLDWGLSVLNKYTTPKVTYKANVLQLHAAGMDIHGIALGDAVQCADRKFSEEGLIIEGRITELVTYFKDERKNDVTIGHISEPIAVRLAKMSANLSERIDGMSQRLDRTTYTVLYELLDAINQQINASGGYTYLVGGIGAVTYDTVVTDPAVGSEATRSVEMRGGTLRFANTKNSSGEWNWTNVITADGYLGLAATIARLTAGFIGSATSGNYWNLDTGELRMAAGSTMVGTQSLADYIADNLGLDQQDVFNLLTNNGALLGLYMYNGELYMNASYIQSGTINADLITAGSMSADRITSGTMSAARINGGELKLGGSNDGNGTALIYDSSNNLFVRLDKYGVRLYHSSTYSTLIQPATHNGVNYMNVTNTSPNSSDSRLNVGGYHGGSLTVGSYTRGSDYYSEINASTSTLIGNVKIGDCLKVGSNQWSQSSSSGTIYCNQLKASWSGYGLVQAERLSVSGSKSRVVETDNYSDRMLYCHETPSPMFGDVGSATISEDGICVVSIDDIFQETARTDMAYQVFLQKCGRGDLWVAEKHCTYFVVEGTPGLPFDWQLMAHQRGYETTRIEDASIENDASTIGIAEQTPYNLYEDELCYIQDMENLY